MNAFSDAASPIPIHRPAPAHQAMKIIEPPRRQERQVFRNQNQIIQSSSSLIFLGVLAVTTFFLFHSKSKIYHPKFSHPFPDGEPKHIDQK
jgi:hypothetical protein